VTRETELGMQLSDARRRRDRDIRRIHASLTFEFESQIHELGLQSRKLPKHSGRAFRKR
jgi:hypothetical protein